MFMYICPTKKQLIGLIMCLVTNYLSYAMEHIINRNDISLDIAEVVELPKLVSAWQEFYRNNDYRDLMASSNPIDAGCGIIHELKNIPILRSRQNETACIVDMTKVVGATEPHYHERQVEVYFILQGTGIVVVGGQKYPVKPGDFVYIPRLFGHYTVPNSDLIVAVVNVPYFDSADFFDLIEADDKTRTAVHYDHVQYLRYMQQQS